MTAKIDDYTTHDGASKLAAKIQGYWHKHGQGWVRCSPVLSKSFKHKRPNSDETYLIETWAVASNMRFVNGGRGPVVVLR